MKVILKNAILTILITVTIGLLCAIVFKIPDYWIGVIVGATGAIIYNALTR